ncbi:MAG: DUF5615 family PIN-like protein [Synechococcales cyanobacterium CRU_2_2]|nr:DUF5615 family PIN-like protein [Synechococcales cyanobacterium CRU_2_2]
MSQIRLYIDEDSQDTALLPALRARQIDILTVQETNTFGLPDIQQLRLTTQHDLVLYSHNIRDFCQLHAEFLTNNENHAGIALLAQDYSIGEQVRAILEFTSAKTAEDMQNQLEFLSQYIR